jgi:tetratricopeptide (TPR) repeat protein
MWGKLMDLQKKLYGEDSETLIFVYKNRGICFLGVGESKSALESYNKAVEIQKKEIEAHKGINRFLRSDYTELSQMYFSMYLGHLTSDEVPEAKKCLDDNIDVYNLLKNLKVEEDTEDKSADYNTNIANCYYLRSTVAMKEANIELAQEDISKAISYYGLSKEKNEALMCRYMLSKAKLYKIKDDVDGALKTAEEAMKSTKENDPLYDKERTELQSIIMTCKRVLGQPIEEEAEDKDKAVKSESKEEADGGNMGLMMGLMTVVAATTAGVMYAMKKKFI